MLRMSSPGISSFATRDTPLGRRSVARSFASATPTSTRRHHRRNKFGFGSDTSTSFDEPSLASGYGVGSRNASPTRRVRVTDQELLLRAARVRNSVDFDATTDLSRNRWAWRESHKEFSLFSIDADAERRHEVLAAGDLNCSIEEIESVLHATSIVDFNMAMKGMLREGFIFGSVVHALPVVNGPTLASPPVTSPEPSSSAASASSDARENYVAVKTSAFVRSKLFARNEEWCFLESFDRAPSGDCLLLSQSTMDAAEVGAGKAPHSRVDQLRDVTTALYVEKLPNTQRGVRVFFHGKYDGGLRSYIDTKGAATPKTSKARLMALARGASRLSDLVRRRRLGIQTMASRTAFTAAKNAFCTCCTKSLHVFTKKKRCYLCAYYVCDKCWSEQKMETCNGKTSTILICTRCLESVDACEYAGVFGESKHGKTRHLIRVEPDDGAGATSAGRASGSRQQQPIAKALVDILAQSLSDSDDAVKTAAVSVIRHILSLEQPDRARESQSTAASRRDASPMARTSSDTYTPTDQDHVRELERCFELDSQARIEDCVLANAEARSYPIHVPANPLTT
ncbi:hypothetical protein PybrP1_011980, partial [[Pythium] brassicae (nom. inval.)]